MEEQGTKDHATSTQGDCLIDFPHSFGLTGVPIRRHDEQQFPFEVSPKTTPKTKTLLSFCTPEASLKQPKPKRPRQLKRTHPEARAYQLIRPERSAPRFRELFRARDLSFAPGVLRPPATPKLQPQANEQRQQAIGDGLVCGSTKIMLPVFVLFNWGGGGGGGGAGVIAIVESKINGSSNVKKTSS